MLLAPERELVTPTEQDVSHIKAFQEALVREESHETHPTVVRPAQLVAPSGEKIDIPGPIYEVLRHVVPLMAQGATIGLIPLYKELTTQEAADLLNISRPSLIRHLDAGEIPYHRLEGGTHRRIRFADIMAYKDRRSATRHAAFAEMAAIGEKYGAYDADADNGLFDVESDEMEDGLD